MRQILLLFAFFASAAPLLAQTSGNPGVNVCEVAATPATVRAEGIAELAGDIVITCVNATAPGVTVTASEAVMNVFVRTSVDATNDVNFGAGVDRTDAVLVVNENNCSAPASSGGRFGGCGAPSSTVQDPQFAQRISADQSQWLSVRAPVPSGPGNPGVTTLRITGLRVRASQNGVPQAAIIPPPITASVSFAAQGFSLVSSGIVEVANPIRSLFLAIPNGLAGRQCEAGGSPAALTIREGFGAALRVGGAPSFLPNAQPTESGYVTAAPAGRLLLRFYNIPQGASLNLPRIVETGSAGVAGDALRVELVDGAAADGAGGAVPGTAGSVTLTSTAAGETYAVYQVMDANPAILEALPITPTISWAPGVQGGVIRVSVYPAPLSTVTASDAAAPEPRFLDSPTVWSYFSIAPCRSTLLFPYATQGAGFDTRLILDNRTANLPGVGPQAGACVLKFRGQNAPADQTTPSIAPGSQFDASLSALAPGFSGHVSAQCDFEGAAGVAILTNGAAVYESPAERLDVAEALPMLFPYAVQSATFDTRIAIANPTLDTPAGIGPASGTCRIDYFGTNAPPAQFTTEIAAGQELTFTLSGGAPAQGVAAAPGFSGYVTVNCTFPFARSFAAVTELSGGAAVRGYGYAPERFEARFTFDPTEDTGPDQDPPSALLAPYVSARGGEETLFAIANASLDTAGTVPAAGSCTLELHGDGAVSAPTPQTFTLSPGESVVFPVSQGSAAYAIAGAPDFRGYATLSCDFERARAAVLLTRAGGGTHADRAEALAIPRNPAPSALFEPYVSSRSGEDRLIAFASTAPDGFGSPTQDATCTLAFHGTGAPVSGVFLLPAGQVRAFLLSRGAPALGVPPAPAFQGFLDTSCTGGLERVVDYRVAPDATLSPFCEIDSTPGTQASDVVALTGLLGQPVAVGHPGDPDGDGIITSNDVQYCNGQSGGVQTEPDPETDPGGSGGSEGSGGNGGSGGRSTPTPEPTPSSGADLRVSWTTSAGAAKPRRGLSLTARVTNAGPQAATAATAWLAPPSALELSRLPQQCTQESTQLRCELGMIAAGQTITLELSGTVSLAAQRELVASAQVVGAEADPNQANNTAYITVPLETQVDLSVSAYLLPRFPAPGETATLTISATNRGPAWADNVSLSAELAPEIELLQTPNGCTLSGSQLRCSPGTLPTGRTRAYLLQVRVSTAGGGFQGGGGGSGFLADVTGASSTPDYALDNNTVRVVQGQ